LRIHLASFDTIAATDNHRIRENHPKVPLRVACPFLAIFPERRRGVRFFGFIGPIRRTKIVPAGVVRCPRWGEVVTSGRFSVGIPE